MSPSRKTDRKNRPVSGSELIFDPAWGDQLFEFLDLLDGSGAAQRGRKYALEGRVLRADALPDEITASVDGSATRPYRTRLILTRAEGIETQCDCPVAFDCKHTYAVALGVIGYALARGCDGLQRFDDLLPGAWLLGKSTPPISPYQGCHRLVIEAGESAREDEAEPWWRTYLRAKTPAQRERWIDKGFRRTVGQSNRHWGSYWKIRSLTAIANPIQALRQFVQLTEPLGHGYGRTGEGCEDLRQFLASPEAHSLFRDFARQESERALTDWLTTQRAGDGPGAPLGKLELRWVPEADADGLWDMNVQLLLTSGTLVASPRKPDAILRLQKEVAGGTRELDRQSRALLAWAVRDAEALNTTFMRREDLWPLEEAIHWFSRWSGDAAALWEDLSEPLVFESEEANLSLVGTEGSGFQWVVRLPGREDPEPLDPDRLVLDGGGRAFWRDGATLRPIFTGGMPRRILAALSAAGETSLAALRQSGLGEVLVRRLLPEAARGEAAGSNGALLREVPVRTQIHYRLLGGHFLVSAMAEGAGTRSFERSAPWSWLSSSGPLPVGAELEPTSASDLAEDDRVIADAGGEALAVFPARKDLAPTEDWLTRIIPERAKPEALESGEIVWKWKATTEAIIGLAVVWEDRPRTVTHLANEAFRDLLTLRGTPSPTASASVSANLGGTWLDVRLDWRDEYKSLRAPEIQEALTQQTGGLVVLKGSMVFRRDALEEARREIEWLAEMGIDAQESNHRVHIMQMLGRGSEGLLKHGHGSVRLNELAKAARSSLENFRGVPAAPIAKETDAPLRVYQREGADFLVWAGQTFGGAVLSDDMGLGKTLQMLAALTALRTHLAGKGKRKKAVLPALVVCPASVAHAWRREAERFVPSLKKVVVLESGAGRKEVLKDLANHDLVIMNYALARRDQAVLEKQPFLAIVADEAQALKNANTATAKALRSLTAHYRFALTGTPVENRLEDLWSILAFAVPGYLGPVDRLPKGDSSDSAWVALRARLRPVLLRREKTRVAPELPPRIEERVDCELTTPQRRAYLAQVKRTKEALAAAKKAPKGPGQGKARMTLLADLTRLRQICCDPALAGLGDMASGKVKEFESLVADLIDSGEKVLVFSQFVKMLQRLEPHLNRAGIPYRMLTGDTKNRQELIEAFEAETKPSVFLISLKAGGTGLTLTSASHVILFDPWWNPAVEAQAIDRAHRIGQQKPVVALRLVAQGTIEERIAELQEHKRSLVEGLMDEGQFHRRLGFEDIAYLLGEGPAPGLDEPD
ncbi:MAG: DEAD/DEAH box helicase [Sumerlaeia bacterium]